MPQLKLLAVVALTVFAPVAASAPAPAKPARVRYAARREPVKRDCVGVLSGISGGMECF